ncbi:MAG TPA: DUF2703 domain-containing protein [Atribacteraceae bacterium]|nr:DUF2703 domain-containing protein [Atribacteraceae bacterium]
MKHLEIEWRHAEGKKEGLYCAQGGQEIGEFVAELSRELAPESIKLTFQETSSPGNDTDYQLLVNKIPLETLLCGEKIALRSCSCLSPVVGSKVKFLRILHTQGKTYLEVPEVVIRQAVRKATALP